MQRLTRSAVRPSGDTGGQSTAVDDSQPAAGARTPAAISRTMTTPTGGARAEPSQGPSTGGLGTTPLPVPVVALSRVDEDDSRARGDSTQESVDSAPSESGEPTGRQRYSLYLKLGNDEGTHPPACLWEQGVVTQILGAIASSSMANDDLIHHYEPLEPGVIVAVLGAGAHGVNITAARALARAFTVRRVNWVHATYNLTAEARPQAEIGVLLRTFRRRVIRRERRRRRAGRPVDHDYARPRRRAPSPEEYLDDVVSEAGSITSVSSRGAPTPPPSREFP
jgi:hypothetical protein